MSATIRKMVTGGTLSLMMAFSVASCQANDVIKETPKTPQSSGLGHMAKDAQQKFESGDTVAGSDENDGSIFTPPFNPPKIERNKPKGNDLGDTAKDVQQKFERGDANNKQESTSIFTPPFNPPEVD